MTSATAKKARELVLGRDVILARFERHYCDGRYLIRARSEVTVKGRPVAKERTSSPRNILIPDKVHEILRQGFGPLDALVDGLERYPIAGLRGMTETALETFVPAWDEGQEALYEARRLVREAWDKEVDAWNRGYWEEILGVDYEDSVGRRLRHIRDGLNRLYSYDYDLWQAPCPADAVVGRSPVVRKWLEEGRANAEKAVEAALLAFVTGPRNTLVEAAEAIIATIKDPETKVIKVGTFNAMRQAMAKLRSLREISDAELIAQMDSMEDQLDVIVGTAEDSSEGFTATIKHQADLLVGAITGVIQAARDEAATEDVLAAFGKSGRAVDLD